MQNIKTAINYVLTKSVTNEKHLSLINQNLNVELDDSVETAIKKLIDALSKTKDIHPKQIQTYKAECRKTLKESGASDPTKKQDIKKFYVAIFNDEDKIIRVRRLFNETKAKEVIEENQAFGYRAERGWLGQSDKGLSWRSKGNHANRDNKNIKYVPHQLII